VPSIKQRWLILVSALVIMGFEVGLYHAMLRFNIRKPDFAALYQGGRTLDFERFPSLPNRFPALKSTEYSVQIDGHEYVADNLHPPYEMALYAALALLKFRTAYLLWWACNLGCLFSVLFVLWPCVPKLQSSYPYLLILAATFSPVLVALVQGQNSIVLLAFLALCYGCLESGHEFRAGLALSMGMFKFVIVIPLAFWLILEKRWKSLAGFVCGCVALFTLALWLVGMTGIVAYVRLLAGFGKKGPELPGTESIMPNLRGLFHVFSFGIVPGTWISVVTMLSSIALLVWIDLRLRQYRILALNFAIQVLLACMISYHLYPHDAAVLILPLLLLLNHTLQYQSGRALKLTVLTCAGCAYLVPLFGGLYVGMPAIGLAGLVLLIVARQATREEIVNGMVHVQI